MLPAGRRSKRCAASAAPATCMHARMPAFLYLKAMFNMTCQHACWKRSGSPTWPAPVSVAAHSQAPALRNGAPPDSVRV